MLTRLGFLHQVTLCLAVVLGLAIMVSPIIVQAAEPEEGPNGLFTQDWFHESFLDMQEDVAEAAAEGKNLAILWEQRGCPYCREMHSVNLGKEKIRSYIQDNFVVIQLDMWGSREVTDFDGEVLGEREMARKWQVHFTPTIMFFPADPGAVEDKSAHMAEVMRMPGYFRPFHFISMFEFVRGGHYADTPFQRFLQHKFEELEAKGEKPEVW